MGLESLAKSKVTTARQDAVNAALIDMTIEQVEAFRHVIHDTSTYSSASIARALRADGFDIKDSQVVYYRNKLRNGEVTL
ncbi:hypothetical protein [Glutamicibacter arilaitensis]|uniref:hypothetical protein n=1 Tax=Glutamicibacter arilaitensis TaxID=256701 RepID=UPI003F8FE7EA